MEPERDENAESSRKALEQAGIKAVSFYKTVEFSENLEAMDCARLEAQLQKMGILDALVVSPDDFENIRRQCPGFLDTVLRILSIGEIGMFKLENISHPVLKKTAERMKEKGRPGIRRIC